MGTISNPQLLRGVQLAVIPGSLDELDHLHLEAHADGAKRGAQCGRGFSLAVAGVHDDEADATAFGIFSSRWSS